jgi:hypothetical protein
LVFVWKERGDETFVDQSVSSSSVREEEEISERGREREREIELSGVRRPRILSAPWADVRGGGGGGKKVGERGVLRGIDGVKGEEVAEREEVWELVGDSRTGVRIVDWTRLGGVEGRPEMMVGFNGEEDEAEEES